MDTATRLSSSFRDPSGFIFVSENALFRQVNVSYRDQYDRLMASGLYAALVEKGLLVPHEEVEVAPPEPGLAYKVIAPRRIPFISYPYEWPFSALKAAALATLDIHLKALEFGLALKDASAYNIQFVDGKPLFLDTLSFERYVEGEPWVAYRQFCQHFLAPLLLMSRRDVRLSQLLRVFIDGVPLDLASAMLPRRSYLSFGTALHIHMHARSQQRHADDAHDDARKAVRKGRVSKQGMLGLIDSLRSLVRKLSWRPGGTEWGDYYEDTNYTDTAMQEKVRLVGEFLDKVQPKTAWDLGANTGVFSRLASERGVPTVAFDIDPAAVEKNFLRCVAKGEKNLLPLVLDLTNPSPALGWHNAERDSLVERGPADLVMALALIHHLAISNNVPLPLLADFFAGVSRSLVIEFVPKSDSQVKRLLATREDIFPNYTQEGFEAAFSPRFAIEEKHSIAGSERTLYRMRRRQ